MKGRNTLIATAVTGIALLTPVAASASEHARPDDRAGARGALALVNPAAVGVRPDDRGGIRGNEVVAPVTAASARPDDRAGYRGPSAPVTARVTVVSNGFDWRDAFVGGLSGIGITLLLMGGLFLAMNRRTRARIA
ncbi:MAG: hypothetical protein ACJ74R_03050 [Gaiellaceae bacterium]